MGNIGFLARSMKYDGGQSLICDVLIFLRDVIKRWLILKTVVFRDKKK